MKVIIPLKTNSTRVPNKNLRPFHGGRSLFDIRAAQLRRVFPPEDVYVSSELPAVESIAAGYNFRFLLREERLTHNETPFDEVIDAIFAHIPGDDDLLWTSVTDPFFDGFPRVAMTWQEVDRTKYDSLLVVRPLRAFILDEHGRPINHGFGPWHVTSQGLDSLLTHNFACQIVTRAAACRCRYVFGARPYLFHWTGPEADIDTMDDFRRAQILYEELQPFTGDCPNFRGP